MKHIYLFILGATLGLNSYGGEIYKSRDQHGTITYSDRKPKNSYEAIDKGDYRGKTQVPVQLDESAPPTKRLMASIQAITEMAKPKVNAIYRQRFLVDRTLQGTLAVRFSIDREGRVIECSEDESAMSKSGFAGQVCAEIKLLEYGNVQEDEATTVNYTYNFAPAK